MKICTVPFKAGAVHIFSNNKNLEGEMIIMRQLSYIIEPEAEGLSVNAYARNIAGLSRAFLRSVKFRENGILINGQRVTTRGVLHTGDCLVFNMPNDRTQKIVPAEGPVSIAFENEDIVLVNKPSGLVIHPCHGHYSDTLLSYLAWHYRLLPEQPLLCPIGRLDKDTSGLILVAKNKYAAQQLEGQRASHTLSRVYLALTEGHWSNQSKSGLIDRPIEKVPDCFNRYQVSDTGRPSRTEYEVLSEFSHEGTPFSLVRLKLQTGRTHQIRVHMASLSHPLLGDSIYGHAGFLGFNRAALHSFEITCQLPGCQEATVFSSEMPIDFQKLITHSSSIPYL